MKKTNKWLIIFISIFAILILSYFLFIKDYNSLNKITGVWGKCDINKICYIANITEENDEYTFSIGQYATDGIITGKIKTAQKISKNEYKIEVYQEGCTGTECIEEKEGTTYYYNIKTNKDKIIIDNNEYEYITNNFSNTTEIENYINN